MRIALVSDTYAPQVNGVTTVVNSIREALVDAGHAVALVAPRYPAARAGPREWELRVPSVPFPPYPDIRLSLPQRRRVSRLLDRFGPDVVHVATEGPLGILGRGYALARGVPLVTSFHTDFPRYCRDYGVGGLAPLVWRWLLWFHGPARVTQTPGEAVRDELVRRGLPRAVVWGRGVDTTLFHPGRRDAVWRRQFGARPDDVVVLHVGRLAPEKNIEVLVHAWQLARETLRGRATFVVAGDGPLADRLDRELPWVHRLGFLPREDLATVYASADICVLPSSTETCGLVAVEAMAAGIPVVAADAGGLRESVRHGENGLLVPPDDARGFAAAVVELAMEAGRRRRLGEAARRAAESRDRSREMTTLLALYETLSRTPVPEPACTAA